MSRGRFVLLRHEPGPAGPRELHWDLMLECGSSLRTWALASEPRVGAEIAAIALPDHRLAYLDYEGPVSGNRGSVQRVDRGTFSVTSESPQTLVVTLDGEQRKWHVQLAYQPEAQRWMVAFSTG